ncbi:MAG TPA: hypothetical protein VFQ50_06160 [Flavobacterium sp.]|nr:hypothetical protein [Flavobacterium sp.]
MKKASSTTFWAVLFFSFMLGQSILAQETSPENHRSKSLFWERVQFGGNLGVAIGSGYTDITVAPGAIFNINEMFAVGAGLQYSYMRQRDFYSTHLYGVSVIGLFNPIPQIQLSAEVEQLRANVKFDEFGTLPAYSDDFWNTGLFVGAGYRTNNITVGVRYNVLFKEDRGVYSNAFMPFVRVYF